MTENLELREWIAVNVMGLQVHRYAGDEWVGVLLCRLDKGAGGTVVVPPYELTWNDAALVVEAMRARGTFIEIAAIGWGYAISWMRFSGPAVAEPPLPEVTGAGAQKARSLAEAPLAICLAAKAAIEGTQ